MSAVPEHLIAPVAPPFSPGEVLALISTGAVATRADIARLTGLARSTVSQRVDALIAHGFVDEDNADGGSTGGRPPRRLQLRTREHAVAGVDLGASHCRVALLDIGGEVLALREDPLTIGDGPEAVLGHVQRTLRGLLKETGRDPATLQSIGVGVPGPVEFSTGRSVDPPIMPGWHQYPIPEFFADQFGVRALVDNDVNVMALAEQRRAFPETRYLLYLKVGTGIGCGIVADGKLHRGSQGCAGDIGHIRVGEGHEPCRCGNFGCLEAVAGGTAIARRLAELGHDASSGTDVVRLVKSGNRDAVQMVREAGRAVGEVLAGLVNFFNPDTVVLGGILAAVHDQLLAGVREVVYRRSHPLATHVLQLEPSRTGQDAAAVGAGILAIEHALSPSQVNRALAGLSS